MMGKKKKRKGHEVQQGQKKQEEEEEEEKEEDHVGYIIQPRLAEISISKWKRVLARASEILVSRDDVRGRFYEYPREIKAPLSTNFLWSAR